MDTICLECWSGYMQSPLVCLVLSSSFACYHIPKSKAVDLVGKTSISGLVSSSAAHFGRRLRVVATDGLNFKTCTIAHLSEKRPAIETMPIQELVLSESSPASNIPADSISP